MDFSQFLKRGATITPLLQEAQFDAASLKGGRAFLSRWAWDDGHVAIVTLWMDEVEGTSVPFKRFVNPALRPELKGNRRAHAEEVYSTLARNKGKAIRVLLQRKRSNVGKRGSGHVEARGLDPEPWYVAADPRGLRLQRSIRPEQESRARPPGDRAGTRLLVCNIGWMERYRGLQKDDEISGQFGYLKEHGMGHEICNFLPDGEIQYGYVQATHQIKLEKLGANPDDSELSGVTVIWTAKRPKGRTVVVGWYRNATVHRHFEPLPTINDERRAHKIDSFNVSAATKDTTLLRIDERTLEVPRGSGGMGQSPIWYADSVEASEFRRKVAALVQSGHQVARGSTGRQQDQLKKVEVERAAVDFVWAHFSNLGYELKSVEKDNVGWDLEAYQGAIVLKIEVKGLSATNEVIELTPNEYKVWNAAPPEYRLAIVSDALRHPRMTICRHSAEQGSWITDTPQKAVFVEVRPAARIRIGSSS